MFLQAPSTILVCSQGWDLEEGLAAAWEHGWIGRQRRVGWTAQGTRLLDEREGDSEVSTEMVRCS